CVRRRARSCAVPCEAGEGWGGVRLFASAATSLSPRRAPLPALPFAARKGGASSMLPIFLVQPLVQRLALHPRFGLLGEAVGQLVGGAGDFGAQLEEVGDAAGIQFAALDRGAHRAARFLRMPAVAEPALRGQRLD